MIKAVIFDIGGVCYSGRMELAFKELSKELNSKEAIDIYYENEEEMLKGEVSAKDFCDLLSNKINKSSEEIHNIIMTVWKDFFIPNKELLLMIKNLSRKYKVACLSNATEFDVENDKRTGFEKAFKPYLNSCDFKLIKPKKEFFLLALKKLNLNAEECLFIDDEESNIKAAKDLGFNAIIFKDVEQLRKDFEDIGVNYD